jgi:hypothetical protein
VAFAVKKQVSDTVPMGVGARRRMKMRGKKESHSAASERKSSARGCASRIHMRLWAWGCSRPSKTVGASPSAKRISYWPTQAGAPGSDSGCRSEARGRPWSGIVASAADQVRRRWASTAVAVTATWPCCSSCRLQRWVERLVRTGWASISKAPSATGPAKLTVSEIGSPWRRGCSSTALSSVAAVVPPKGPTMLV